MEIRQITKSFGGKNVLSNVSFVFPESATTGIVGDSGRGKTTLVNILLRLVRPDSGMISIPDGWRMGCVFQEDRLIEHMSARKNIALTAHPMICEDDISDALAELGLEPGNDGPVSKYSGGMRRRVAIARAVLARPELLILDEPFKGLDMAAREAAARFIMRKCPDACRVLVTHDREELALMHAAKVLELK
jgi:NitT/TauT family transport system ATP-binding protein